MTDDIRLGRIAGFPLAMNWSVLAIIWLLTWGLADGALPADAPGHAPATYWIAALVAALVFFASLLAHELGHAIVARRAGVEVKGISLWLFGGVASLGSEPPSAKADFRIAIVGPAISLALAAVYGASATGFDAVGGAHIAVAVATWLAAINLLLGVFNLIPGAPLDGGRVLRAFLWHRHGDRVRAAVTATRTGQMVAYGLIWFGFLEFFAGAGVSGLWLVVIGWFIWNAARAEEIGVRTRRALTDVTVEQVMTSHPDVAPGWLSAADFVEQYLRGPHHSAYPVQQPDGTTSGILRVSQVCDLSPAARDVTRVADVAVPLERLPIAHPSDPALNLLGPVGPGTGGRALVFNGTRLVGILTRADMYRAIESHETRRPQEVDRHLPIGR